MGEKGLNITVENFLANTYILDYTVCVCVLCTLLLWVMGWLQRGGVPDHGKT